MDFRLLCPKCGTTDYAIERDRRIRTLSDPAAGLIFSCRCGKQLFGAQVEEEYKRQYKAWESEQSTRRASRPDRAGNREEPAVRRSTPVGAPAEAEAVPARASGTRNETVADLGEDVEICAWHPCEKVARPGSKYCSRACSNKNARWRYKQRKSNEREAA